MKMGLGMWIAILGILAIILGAAIYAAYSNHHTMGIVGIILGLILVVVGVWWWMMKDKTAPKAAIIPQPAQPAKTP